MVRHKELTEKTGYSFVFDIIVYFSKFMCSFEIKENNARYTLLAIKEFCFYVGYPKIILLMNFMRVTVSNHKKYIQPSTNKWYGGSGPQRNS